MTDRILLNEYDAAAMVGMSVHWLRKGRYEGFGPKVTRIGTRAVRYDRTDLIAYIDECKEGALG